MIIPGGGSIMNNSYIYPDVNLLSESYKTVQIGKHTDNPEMIVEFFSSNGIAAMSPMCLRDHW